MFVMEEEEYLNNLRSDFKNFLYVTWEALSLPVPSRVQYDMADYLQSDTPRLMIQAMRGAGKSYITSAFAVWCLFRNPDSSIICLSAVQNRAREFIRLSRKIIDALPFLSHLVPDVNDLDGADRFVVGARTYPQKNPSVAAYGIKSMITGSHSDIIICDDIEIPQNSMTVESRELLLQRCKELESVLNPGGRIIFLGTPQSFDSVYKHLEASYRLRKWTARYPSLDSTQADNLSPLLVDDLHKGTHKPGDPTYPEYYSNDTLLEREAIMGTSNFQLQMMLDTSLTDTVRFPLHISALTVHPISPHAAPQKILWGNGQRINIPSPSPLPGEYYFAPAHVSTEITEYSHRILAIDPAGKGKDSTGVAIILCSNGSLFIPHVQELDGYTPETLKRISYLVSFWGIKQLVIESNMGSGMFTQLLIPNLPHPCAIEEVRNSIQKEIRIIDTLEPLLINHRVIIDPEVARNNNFSYQISHITRDRGSLKHDDILDAVALGCNFLKEYVAVDPITIANKRVAAERDKEIKQFLEAYKAQALPKGRGVSKGYISMDREGKAYRGSGWLRDRRK